MFEVEKKFTFDPKDEELLRKGSEFIVRKKMRDMYFDTRDFKLTKKDLWLRLRNDQFELKVPIHNSVEREADQYQELETEEEICTFLKIPKKGNFVDSLKEAGYKPFCDLITIREKYKHPPFIIDIDQVTGKNFSYNLAEIELMVNKESEIQEAIKTILAFAKEKNLKTGYTRGKVIEYLYQIKPEHFKVLQEAGVVK